MSAASDDRPTFTGTTFVGADFSGVTIRDSRVSGLRIVNSYIDEVRVSGFLHNLLVNDVDVGAFVEAELDRRHPERVQRRDMRSADDFRSMWSTIEALWSGAVERAQRLPEAARQEQLDGEWSFVETMRHLVFATDAWVSRTVLGQPRPYHSLGIAHSEFPLADSAAIGLDVDARPTFDEVTTIRSERMTVTRDVVSDLTDEGLDRLCDQSPTPDFPDERHTVRQCLRTVMNEEVEHFRYATRDLAVLETRA